MGWLKVVLSAVLPYIVDAIKYAANQLTLKKKREERAKKKAEAAAKYEAAKTEAEVEAGYENLP